jgi:hypothetical protein
MFVKVGRQKCPLVSLKVTHFWNGRDGRARRVVRSFVSLVNTTTRKELCDVSCLLWWVCFNGVNACVRVRYGEKKEPE